MLLDVMLVSLLCDAFANVSVSVSFERLFQFLIYNSSVSKMTVDSFPFLLTCGQISLGTANFDAYVCHVLKVC